MPNPVTCPYCRGQVELVTGDTVYPNRSDLHEKHFYICWLCDAYVGCHPGTDKPLGDLANKELRSLRRDCHSKFDELWKPGWMSRTEAYRWLSERLGVKTKHCHFAMFNLKQCQRALIILKEKWRK